MNAVASSSLETSKELFNKEAFFERLKQDKIIFESFLPPGSSCKSATIAELREAQAKIRIQIPGFFSSSRRLRSGISSKKNKAFHASMATGEETSKSIEKAGGKIEKKIHDSFIVSRSITRRISPQTLVLWSVPTGW